MSNDVKYLFNKSYFVLGSDRETVGVTAYAADNQNAVYSLPQNKGTPRDYHNKKNVLKDLPSFIENAVKKIKIDTQTHPDAANVSIAKQIGNSEYCLDIDKKVTQDIKANRKYHENLFELGNYINMLNVLTKFEPRAVEALLRGTKYPKKSAFNDFLRGVTHKDVKNAIENMSKKQRQDILDFAEKNNFKIDYSAIVKEDRELFGKIHKSQKRSNLDVDMMINRTAIDMLHDAAQYKYYQRTGNMGIFLSDKESKEIENMSDKDIAEHFGKFAVQYYGDAIVVAKRIERIISNQQDITQFATDLRRNLNWGFQNQGSIRIIYNAIRGKYNKFSKNKAVTNLISGLYYYCTDQHLARQMQDEFGIRPDLIKKQMQSTKTKRTNALHDAAKRLHAGNIVSGTVVAEEIAYLENQYGVVPNDGNYTAAKIQDKKCLTKSQKEILERFGKKSK